MTILKNIIFRRFEHFLLVVAFLALFERRAGEELEVVSDDGVVVLVALLSVWGLLEFGKLTTENDKETFFLWFLTCGGFQMHRSLLLQEVFEGCTLCHGDN